jgi:hypothetical protein
MPFLFVAALLPALFWDKGTTTAPALKEAGIQRMYVPAGAEEAWRELGFTAVAFNAARFTKTTVPGVQYRMDVASATSVPWIDANGWLFQRDGAHEYTYDVPKGHAGGLAAAEAYAYGVDAAIHVAPEDLQVFGRMLDFLRRIDRPSLPAMANIGVIDDGSDDTGEVLNLMARHNLLFRVIQAPDPKYDLNIRIGSKEYPKEAAEDPYQFAKAVRQKLTDAKRLLRLFGSDVVIGRLTGDGSQARVHLLNYDGRKIPGLRVRVLGTYAKGKVAAFGYPHAALEDCRVQNGATEFTVSEMGTYAAIDLQKE